MKWIGIFIFILPLTACIYTDEPPVIEPREVVVSQQTNTWELGDNWASIDVTNPTVTSY